eukprot:13485914-Alexandrium_andersonii.AAC.1
MRFDETDLTGALASLCRSWGEMRNQAPCSNGGSTRVSTPTKTFSSFASRRGFVPKFLEIKGFITDWKNRKEQSMTRGAVD